MTQPNRRICSFDYRTTFLRRHIANQLGWSNLESHEELLRNFLPLDDLWRRIVAQWKKKQNAGGPSEPRADQADAAVGFRRILRKYVTPEEFFYSRSYPQPDVAPYFPVEVVEVEDPDEPIGEENRRFRDLTNAILQLDRDQAEHGVVLTACSGAGKTVAQRRAFFDCFCGVDPPLAGFLPCWLSTKDSLASDGGVQGLLLLAARLENQFTPANVNVWLQYGPKVLVFLDLNRAALDERAKMAHAIHSFQQEYGRQGHRMIVAYRSTQTQDPVAKDLCQGNVFRRFEMSAWSPEQSEEYLRNIRNYEDWVYRRLHEDEGMDLEPPERDIDQECEKLGELAARLADRTTPLLMHWVSLLSNEELQKTWTIADLYRHVVRRHIRRDQEDHAHSLPMRLKEEVTGEFLVQSAMTRLALAMLARQGGTRLPIEDKSTGTKVIHSILSRPDYAEETSAQSSRERLQSWWPESETEFWLKGKPSYYFERFGVPPETANDWVKAEYKREVAALLEFSLVRRDGDQIGFLHDSFRDYFAGVFALRHYEGPNCPPLEATLHEDWYRATVTRMCRQPSRWQLAAEYLAGVLKPEALQRLAGELANHLASAQQETKSLEGVPELLIHLLRGGARNPEAVRGLTEAFHLALPSIYVRPDLAFQQILNRARWSESAEPVDDKDVLAWMAKYINGGGYWIRAEAPLPELRGGSRVVARELVGCRIQALSPNGRLLVGVHGRELLVYDVKNGEVVHRHQLETEAESLALGDDAGSVAVRESGGDIRWLGASAILPCRQGDVGFASHNKHGVFAARCDNALVAWDPMKDGCSVVASGVPEPLRVLKVTPDGLHLLYVAGDDPQEICVASAWRREWRIIVRKRYAGPKIVDASIDAGGSTVLLACRDRCLRLLNVDGFEPTGECAYERRPEVFVRGAPWRCALGFGKEGARAFLATEKGQVACWNWRMNNLRRWQDFSLGDRANLLLFSALAPGGGLLVSTDRETTIRNENGSHGARGWHPVEVTGVIFTGGGKIVSACREDKTIRWFSADRLQPEGVRSIPGVTPVCLAPSLQRDTVLVGDEGGVALELSADQGEDAALARLQEPLVSLFEARDGRVVLAGRHGTIARILPMSGEMEYVRLPTGFLSQERILSAGKRGLLWSIHHDWYQPDGARSTVAALLHEGTNERVVFCKSGDFHNAAVTKDRSMLCLAGDSVILLRRSCLRWRPEHVREVPSRAVAFLHDDSLIAVARRDTAWLEVWKVAPELPTVAAIDLPAEATCLCADGTRIAVGLGSGALLSLRLCGVRPCSKRPKCGGME